MKQQWDASGGRTLLGDNTGGGTAMLRPIGFLCAGICFSTGLLHIFFFFLMALQSKEDFFLEVSRSHTQTHHTW